MLDVLLDHLGDFHFVHRRKHPLFGRRQSGHSSSSFWFVGVGKCVHVGDRELAHPGRVIVDVAHRRHDRHHGADHLVQHVHLRQPRRRSGSGARSQRAWILPIGGMARAGRLGLLRSVLLLRRLEHGVDRAQTDAGELLGQLPQFRESRPRRGRRRRRAGRRSPPRLPSPPSPSPCARWRRRA